MAQTECSQCRTTSTPLWRRGDGESVLCNACGLSAKARRKSSVSSTTIKKDASQACLGDGNCTGVGGSSSCDGCPTFNNSSAVSAAPAVNVANPPAFVLPAAKNQFMNGPGAMFCTNCGTVHTPLWRRDDHGRTICNACGLWKKLHGKMRPIELKKQTIKRRKRIVATLPENSSVDGPSVSSDSSYDLEYEADTCTELASQETAVNSLCSPTVSSKKRSRGDDERAAAEALMSVGICRTRTLPPSLASSPSLPQIPVMAIDDIALDYKRRRLNSKTPPEDIPGRTTLAAIPNYNNHQLMHDRKPLKPSVSIPFSTSPLPQTLPVNSISDLRHNIDPLGHTNATAVPPMQYVPDVGVMYTDLISHHRELLNSREYLLQMLSRTEGLISGVERTLQFMPLSPPWQTPAFSQPPNVYHLQHSNHQNQITRPQMSMSENSFPTEVVPNKDLSITSATPSISKQPSIISSGD